VVPVPHIEWGTWFKLQFLDLIKFDSSCENQTCFDLVSLLTGTRTHGSYPPKAATHSTTLAFYPLTK